MTFEEVAQGIVSDFIQTAVCIDDSFVEPYEELKEGELHEIELPKELYRSFRREGNCNLEIIRFSPLEEMNSKIKVALDNADLIILDWELDPSGNPRFQKTLEILDAAVTNPSIPFVIIYTVAPDLSNIELNIRSYFSSFPYSTTQIQDRVEKFFEKVEEKTEVEDASIFFEKLGPKCLDFILGENKRKRRGEIFQTIQENFDHPKKAFYFIKAVVKIAQEEIGENISTIDQLYEMIGYYSSVAIFEEKSSHFQVIRIPGPRKTFEINRTSIALFSKPQSQNESNVNPNEVFSTFSQILTSSPHNFLSLLSLEMKNLFRDNIQVLGQELLSLDEEAFFYHKGNFHSEEEFYDFLIENWNNQTTYFNSKANLALFSVLSEYQQKKGIPEQVENNNGRLNKALSLINFHYSFIEEIERKVPGIRFGDVFKKANGKPNEEKTYFVCITAHCDSLRPQKIGYQFTFLEGRPVKLANALGKAEKEYFSFLLVDEEILSISWEIKPFTLYVPEKRNDVNSVIEAIYQNDLLKLTYQATLKENYSQRLANAAFSFANRVGIGFAHLRDED